MHNKPTAKITVSKFDPESKYMDLKINLDCYFGNDLKVSNTAMKLTTLFKEVHSKAGYLQLKNITSILLEDDYKISYDVNTPLSLELLKHYKLKIISSFNTSQADDQYQIIKIEYKLFIEIKQNALLNSLYGISNMHPNSQAEEVIEFCHHDPRLLDSITKTAHTTPKKVICSGPVTTVIFEDGTKSQVRCSKDDEGYNDYEKAFMMAWLYQLAGKKNVRKVLKENQDIFGDSEETNSIVNALNNIRFMFNGRKG
jgi:hypothetical protein